MHTEWETAKNYYRQLCKYEAILVILVTTNFYTCDPVTAKIIMG